MSAARIRVLIVDDSAFARKVMREVLTTPEYEVVGVAHDGLEALEMIRQLRPDVVTLDLRMPDLDGLGVMRALPDVSTRIIVVTTSEADSEAAVEALAAGAIAVVRKPTAVASAQLYDIAEPLHEAIRMAAGARVMPISRTAPVLPARPIVAVAAAAPLVRTVRLVAIGASTGGPQAISRVLKAFPRSMPVPLAIVVHMPEGYTASFAKRLDGDCDLDVVEASDGLVLRPGLAVIARAGIHLKFVSEGGEIRARLDAQPQPSVHTPSVDAMLESAAAALGGNVLGVVLTGMGDDGLAGARAVRSAGGAMIAEAESSCVVYGMPRCVNEAGLANATVPIERMAEEIQARM